MTAVQLAGRRARLQRELVAALGTPPCSLEMIERLVHEIETTDAELTAAEAAAGSDTIPSTPPTLPRPEGSAAALHG